MIETAIMIAFIIKISMFFYLHAVAFALCEPSAAAKQIRRRNFLADVLPQTIVLSGAITFNTKSALADLNSASASGIPLVGRFEQLKGANSFIGGWKYEATNGIPEGELFFLKNGEVELRSEESIIAVGAVPWKYVAPKGADTIVRVTFTLDEDGQNDVLVFEGSFDAAAGPNRIMVGSIGTGRAEIGARGGGPIKQVGSFKATFLG